jgi:WD40 repeat protein
MLVTLSVGTQSKMVHVWNCEGSCEDSSFRASLAHTFNINDYIAAKNNYIVQCRTNFDRTKLILNADISGEGLSNRTNVLLVVDIDDTHTHSVYNSSSLGAPSGISVSKADNRFVSYCEGIMTCWDINAGPDAPLWRHILRYVPSTLLWSFRGDSIFALSGNGGSLTVYQLDDGNEQQTVPLAEGYGDHTACVSGSSDLFALGTDRGIAIYETRAWKRIQFWSVEYSYRNVVEFSADASKLFSCSFRKLMIWKTDTGDLLFSVLDIISACWFAGDTQILAAAADGCVKCIDASTGSENCELLREPGIRICEACPGQVILM